MCERARSLLRITANIREAALYAYIRMGAWALMGKC